MSIQTLSPRWVNSQWKIDMGTVAVVYISHLWNSKNNWFTEFQDYRLMLTLLLKGVFPPTSFNKIWFHGGKSFYSISCFARNSVENRCFNKRAYSLLNADIIQHNISCRLITVPLIHFRRPFTLPHLTHVLNQSY